MATKIGEASERLWWLAPVAVAIGLVVFAATFFAYADRHTAQLPGGYMPAGLGASIFIISM